MYSKLVIVTITIDNEIISIPMHISGTLQTSNEEFIRRARNIFNASVDQAAFSVK